MTYTSVRGSVLKFVANVIKSSPIVALLLVAMFSTATPARAQSSDTWKSVAIIGGSTAAGALIGHKIGGGTGAAIGAAVGATAGYAIDRHRRQNEYNNEYGYGNGGYYPDNSGDYGNGDPYYGNGGYNGNQAPPYGYQSRYARRR